MKTYLQLAGVGFIAGMRSMSAPALVSEYLTRKPTKELKHAPFRWLDSHTVATALKLAAAGELIGDKMPFTPDRIESYSLLGRVMMGAVSGAALSAAKGKGYTVGTVIGGLGAFTSTFVAYYLRREAGRRLPVPDPVVGGVEDVLVLGSSLGLLNVNGAPHK
ncbi:MAG: DUF4126 family protein [Chloroflexi bacterium]|nr:DUF4126 family protein [Chloroflexota bacterium]